jgi:hypothetical protein
LWCTESADSDRFTAADEPLSQRPTARAAVRPVLPAPISSFLRLMGFLTFSDSVRPYEPLQPLPRLSHHLPFRREGTEGLATVADRVLLGGGEFRAGTGLAVRYEDRVVTEAALTTQAPLTTTGSGPLSVKL